VPSRNVPLIVVASASASVAEDVAARLRTAGNVVYVAHSAAGCLRVATSIAPDVVLLDPALPSRLVGFLRAHPATAGAQILHIEQDEVLRPAFPAWRPVSPTAAAGPHAA
jgi:CheY-like chemotaxis protein